MNNSADISYIISDGIVKKYIHDKEFPWLISFPRTGSHWLRMLMELYFEKPSLVRVFYRKEPVDFTCYHQHDENLSLGWKKNVIYLYRDPCATVYSQMNYYNEDLTDGKRIEYWATLYGKHLYKWLIRDVQSKKKAVIRYEKLEKNMLSEFEKVTTFFGESIDTGKLVSVAERVTKNEVKVKTRHDSQVVNLTNKYRIEKEIFCDQNRSIINAKVLLCSDRLKAYIGVQ